MIKVKRHTRKRKNGVSVVRQHMKKGVKKAVLRSIKEDRKTLSEGVRPVMTIMGRKVKRTTNAGIVNSLRNVVAEHPKTGLIRAGIQSTGVQSMGPAKNQFRFDKSHSEYGVSKGKPTSISVKKAVQLAKKRKPKK